MSQNKCYHYYLVSIWEEKWKEKIVEEEEEEVKGKSYSRTMRVGLDNGGGGGGDEDFRKLITDGI